MTTRSAIVELRDACRAMLAATERVLATMQPDATKPYVERIVSVVADQYGYSFGMMTSRDRTQRVAEARHIAIYLARELTDSTVVELGEVLKRDHGSITYAVASIKERIETEPLLAARVERIRGLVKGLEAAA